MLVCCVKFPRQSLLYHIVQNNTLPSLIKGCMSLLVCMCVYSGCSVACVSAGQGEEGALAALCSRPLAPWINADCLGMTRSSRPHKASERGRGGNAELRGGSRRGRSGGESTESFERAAPFLPLAVSFVLLLPPPHTQTLSLPLSLSFPLSLFITLNLSVSFFIHPLKTNELHSCLCFPGVKMKRSFPDGSPYLPC